MRQANQNRLVVCGEEGDYAVDYGVDAGGGGKGIVGHYGEDDGVGLEAGRGFDVAGEAADTVHRTAFQVNTGLDGSGGLTETGLVVTVTRLTESLDVIPERRAVHHSREETDKEGRGDVVVAGQTATIDDADIISGDTKALHNLTDSHVRGIV